ncbi:hypothetical protein F511_42738 [Dorcoceras hygrometricum]|uniref:Uncharacterized protein n=1 Tax=Dorcoceras hygrometricum TaxID=472368 RepID=A0A2Z7BZE4_9LAMI|nr:hypothetical protein F511_42738 [Dorcoceras hygrometricum]
MRDKSYNAPELIQEDLLCFFGFSRRGVELVGDLDERMDKAEMMTLMEEEAKAGSSGLAMPSKKATKKRRASTPTEKEARREKKKKKDEVPASESRGIPTLEKRREASSLKELEEGPDPTPIINIPEASPEKEGLTEEAGPGRVPPLNFFEDSLVVSPSGVVATNLLCHIAPDRDIDRLALAWGGEVIKRLTRTQREAGNLRCSFDDAVEHYSELEKRLAEGEAAWAEETRAAEMCMAALETRGLRLEAEKAALLSKKKALEGEKAGMKAELDKTKARAEEEAESSEFAALCSKKALGYFKVGFSSCLAQFHANDYPEEEHPASFLDLRKALMDMADEEAAEEEEDAGTTPPSSPKL